MNQTFVFVIPLQISKHYPIDNLLIIHQWLVKVYTIDFKFKLMCIKNKWLSSLLFLIFDDMDLIMR